MSNYKTILWASHFMNLKYNPKPLGPSFGSVLSPKNSANSKMLGGQPPETRRPCSGFQCSVASGFAAKAAITRFEALIFWRYYR